MKLPSVEHPHIGSGPKPNFYKIWATEGVFWFSYKTCIAFHLFGQEEHIRKNDWAQTTGKHLNYINPDKSVRISGKEFEKLLAEA